jgi:hypothetical protein
MPRTETQEDSMMKRIFFGAGAFALLCAALIAAGCGGGAKEGKKSKIFSTEAPKQASAEEFKEPELTGGESSGGGESSMALSSEDESIVIPGSQYGGAPTIVPEPKAKKKSKKGAVVDLPAGYIPVSEGISEQMEGLQWGMSYKKIMALFEQKIRTAYAEELKGVAGDALAEDGVRTRMLREISKMKKSYVEFKGQTTGFEGHMISEEFTHNNNESMLVWDAGKYVEYLFFIDGRFWKRLRAFRKDSFKTDITFIDFLGTIEGRFQVKGREFFDAKGNLDRVSWRNEDTFADVVDRSGFFGAYGLRFESAITTTYLAKLRTNADRDKGIVTDKVSDVVDQVTSASGDKLKDSEASVIDNYTGEKVGNANTELDAQDSVTSKGAKKKKTEEAATGEGGAKTESAPAPKKKEEESNDIF